MLNYEERRSLVYTIDSGGSADTFIQSKCTKIKKALPSLHTSKTYTSTTHSHHTERTHSLPSLHFYVAQCLSYLCCNALNWECVKQTVLAPPTIHLTKVSEHLTNFLKGVEISCLLV